MTLDDLKKMSLNDMREAANKLTDEELSALHDEADKDSIVDLATYPEYRESKKDPKYVDGKGKCFVAGCDKPAYFEGGDARFWCGMCEEHADIRFDYVFDLIHLDDSLRKSLPRVRHFKHPPTSGNKNESN